MPIHAKTIIAAMSCLLISCQGQQGGDEKAQEFDTVAQKLINQFTVEDIKARFCSLGKLAVLGNKSLPELTESLKEEKIETRFYALQALSILGRDAQSALPEIIRLKDEDENNTVRQMAQLAANVIGGDSAAKAPASVCAIPVPNDPPGSCLVAVDSIAAMKILNQLKEKEEKNLWVTPCPKI